MPHRVAAAALLLLLLPMGAAAQQPDDAIDWNNFNIGLLETLVTDEANRLRTARQLAPLLPNEQLCMAAQDQCSYNLAHGQLLHYRKERYKRTVLSRVRHYNGGFRIVGENHHMTYIGRAVRTRSGNITVIRTYRQAARAVVSDWMQSARHYQNLIDPDYARVGTAVTVNPGTKEVYTTQVYASAR